MTPFADWVLTVLRRSSLTTSLPTSTGASFSRGSTSLASDQTWYVFFTPDHVLNQHVANLLQVDARDTENFDVEFTREAPQDSYVDGPVLSQTMQQQFAGWSYNRPVAGLGDAGGSVKDPSFGSIPE